MTIVDATYYITEGMPEWSNNPLVAALGPYRAADELGRDLYRNPYAGRNFATIAPHLRDAAIDELTSGAFVVSPRELEFATQMQRMLWTGLARRNPRRPEVMASVAKFTLERGRDLDSLPWSSEWADAGKVAEPTGVGKSHIPKRILSLWPQAIRHGKLEGVWNGWTQVVWLRLDMSFDGNLNGLLVHILREIDLALDLTTDYATAYPKIAKNRQKLQVWVIDTLKRHFCGMIVLDELQAISLLMGPDSELVANFFLRLLNQGIPMVLEGNPFAFAPFESHSQLWDRIHSNPFPSLLPDGLDDEDSRDFFLPEIWKMQVMPEIAPLTKAMIQAVYDCSAWHPRYVVRGLQNAQRIALARDCTRLKAEHFADGFRLRVEPRIQRRITAFATHTPIDLLEWEDIPVYALAQRWGTQDETVVMLAKDHDAKMRVGHHTANGDPATPNKTSSSERTITVKQTVTRSRAKTKARTTRGANKKKKNNHAVDSTDPKDLRTQGIQSALVENFDRLPSATPTGSPPAMELEEPPTTKQ